MAALKDPFYLLLIVVGIAAATMGIFWVYLVSIAFIGGIALLRELAEFRATSLPPEFYGALKSHEVKLRG